MAAAFVALVVLPAGADAAVTFSQPNSTFVQNPRSVAIGDVNSDGRPDVVAADAPDGVSVMLATGATGNFGAPTSFTAGSSPNSVAIADLTGDGRPDLAVANSGSANVSILRASGAPGNFSAPTNFAVGSSPSSIAVGNLNGSGGLDLAVANQGSGTVSVLLASGNPGSFAAATTFTVGGEPVDLEIADLNADTRSDLAVTTGNNVSLLLASGAAGNFAAPTTLNGGTLPNDVAIGDLNRDGRPDIAVTNLFNVGILLASGAAGSFGTPTFISGGNNTDGIEIGDVNADERPDLVLVGGGSAILLASGNLGSFGSPQGVSGVSSASSVAIGDLNEDERPDLAYSGTASSFLQLVFNTSQPGAQLSPPDLGFGAQDVGGLSPPQAVTITNSGDARLRVSQLKILGGDPEDFIVSVETCTDGALLKGADCTARVRFAPIAAGARSASLVITSNAPASPQKVSLGGNGVIPDETDPEVSIDTGPSGFTADSTPGFGFSANEAATFRCRVDGASFAGCDAGTFTSGPLSDGPHLFEVKAKDGAGNSAIASRFFHVDTRAPRLQITEGPAEGSKVKTKQTTAKVRFEFGVNEQADLECRLDGDLFEACDSVAIFPSVGTGEHAFQVRATDPAGNERTLTRTFKVVKKG
jgi:hypothetical protein